MDNPDAAREPIRLDLSADEALILFEWLAQGEEHGQFDSLAAAERQVLHSLEAQLERTLVAVLDPRYAELLRAARARVAPGE